MDKKTEALKLALEAAYLAGFNDSAEGYNGEYPFRDYGGTPIKDRLWVARRDEYIREALADSALERMAENARELGLDYEPAQQQEPVALPEKIYEFVPTPEPVKWHHPECEGQCIACLIEQVVQEAYGNQGLGYLQRHLTSPPASKPWVRLTDEEYSQLHDGLYQQGKSLGWVVDQVEAKLREKNA